jgi:translocation and assembly module TamA
VKVSAALALGICALVSPAGAQPSAPSPTPSAPAVGASAPPAVDPELLKPLTPLDRFDVGPAAPSVAPSPATPASVTYVLRVVGLRGLRLERRFRALSNLAHKGGRAETKAQLQARAASDVKLIEQLLRANGYYDGAADAAMTPDPKRQGRSIVTLTASPGPLYRLGAIAVTGPQTTPPGLPRKALPLRTGEPIVAAIIESGEATIGLRLPEEGYPFVRLGARAIVLDEDAHTGDYTLPVTPGARSSFGRIVLTGAPVLAPARVALISRIRTGALYDSRLTEDLRAALVATSLYGSVKITPADTGKTATDGTDVVDVQVAGTPAPARTLSGSLGYATGLGASVEAAWTHHDLFPPEGSLTLHAIAGSQESLLDAVFLRSDDGQRDRSLRSLLQLSNESVSAYDADTLTLGARISLDSTPIWQKRWTYSVGAQVLVTRERGYDLALGETTRRTWEIPELPLQAEYDRSDSLLNPTRGFRIILSPTPAISVSRDASPYLKAIVEGDGYLPVLSDVVLAGRLRLGGLVGTAVSDVAPSQRFYSGGGGSVRGYGYEELGPKDSSNDPIGGSSLTEFASELRYRFGDLGLVGFLDGGQVYETSTPRFTDLRLGAGAGVRYYTTFGPIRFDVGTPIRRQAGEAPVSVYISIGQAF